MLGVNTDCCVPKPVTKGGFFAPDLLGMDFGLIRAVQNPNINDVGPEADRIIDPDVQTMGMLSGFRWPG